MRTIVKGKNIEVPDRTRAYTERKLQRLERILDNRSDRSDALVELSVEQHRSASDPTAFGIGRGERRRQQGHVAIDAA